MNAEIHVEREDGQIKVLIGPTPSTRDLDKPLYYVFKLDLQDADHAVLVRQYIMDGLCDLFKHEREAWYEAGWRDKAAKRKKRVWFPIPLRRVKP